MSGVKTKEFRDAVHGYISVPADWCAAFVDTPIFQRLKHIEQTSMRPLYPCARHDRFAHSLGVYHLAKIALDRLRENTDPIVLDGVDLAKYEIAFLAAALMHDCAHAPFSHIFERHYNRNNRAEDFLLSLVDDEFRRDYADLKDQGKATAEHELFSAAVFLEHYRWAFQQLAREIDPIVVARMITGCIHSLAEDAERQVVNCLIQLLNGPAIDVDKLDYVIRDTSSSGVNNISIDVQRLLSSLEISAGPRKRLLVFRKSALSVLQSVLDGRNYLFRWIYSHHTVQYYGLILQQAVERLDEVLSEGRPGAFLDAVFSRQVFDSPVRFGSFSLFLPTDYDFLALLKQHREQIAEVDELLARKPQRIPLWKTQAEFEQIFRDVGEKQRTAIRGKVPRILEDVIGPEARQTLVVPVKPKVLQIEDREVFVKLLDKPIPYEDVAAAWSERPGKRNVSFFYVYIPRHRAASVRQCIDKLMAAPA